MKTIAEIMNFTETFAPLNSAMDFDNCGLLVGDRSTQVSKILVCLDITPEVVKEALQKQAQLVISHHPVIFNGLKSISSQSVPYMLIQNSLSALCLHTNLDLSVDFGVNTCLAETLQLKDTEYFMDKDREICLAIGKTSHSFTEKAFAEHTKKCLNCRGLRFTTTGNIINTVAVSSGSGGGEIYLAKEKGADLLVTGEIKHNQILDANKIGISIVDAGHFKTENVVVAPLAKRLAKEFPDICFEVSEVCSDLISYL